MSPHRRGILSPRNVRGKDEIPPAPFAKGGGLLPDIVDWTEHSSFNTKLDGFADV